MPSVRLPRLSSVRVRAALAAALAAACCFGAGAAWLRQVVHADRLAASVAAARSDARGIAALGAVDPGVSPYPLQPFAIVLDSGEVLDANEELELYLRDAGLRLPLDPPMDHGWTGTVTVHFGTPSGTDRRRTDNRDVTLVVARTTYTGAQLAPYLSGRDPGSRDVLVYVLASPVPADDTIAAIDPFLLAGLPVAVLLVAVVAWVATGRALRPVEAIRAQLADITAHKLTGRVPVPDTGDEIARMAATANQTLDLLTDLIDRQRRFVADAAHELRSPIATLRNTAEVALAHTDPADIPRQLGSILTATRRLQDLTDDLLLLARLDRTTTSATAGGAAAGQTVDLAAIAEEQVTERRYRQPPDHRFTVLGGTALVRGDETELARLLRNLLDNAARHARQHVKVAVTTPRPDTVRLEVHDDGPGIPPGDRERVFDRFTRLDEARERDHGGAGLGLAIARDIARRHGGRLYLAASDGGARFVAELPAEPADSSGALPPAYPYHPLPSAGAGPADGSPGQDRP